MTVGIDVGSTTTKAVAILPSGVLLKATMRATDPLTAASGSLGRLTAESALKIKDIERISITGVDLPESRRTSLTYQLLEWTRFLP